MRILCMLYVQTVFIALAGRDCQASMLLVKNAEAGKDKSSPKFYSSGT